MARNYLGGQPVMHDLPQQQPWYRQPGYRPTNFLMDAAAKFIGQPVYNLMTGGLHKAADEYELGGRGPQALPGKALDATGAVMAGSAFTRAPVNALRSFGGPNAKTADMNAMRRAQELTQQGVSRDRIWNETGWFRGVDGKWRWEIDDSRASWRGAKYSDMYPGQSAKGKSSDFVDHAELYEAYPELADKSVQYVRVQSPKIGTPLGIALRDGTGYAVRAVDETLNKPIRTALHELQHITQNIEGTATGAPTTHPHYRQVAGEVEARAVQQRLNMTPEQRRARPPWLDYDVPEKDQIVNRAKPFPSSVVREWNNLPMDSAPANSSSANLPGALRSGMASIREAETALQNAIDRVNATGADYNRIKHRHPSAPMVREHEGAGDALLAARELENKLSQMRREYLPQSPEYQSYLEQNRPDVSDLPMQYHGTPDASSVVSYGRFKPSKGYHDYGEGVYTTERPDVASRYAESYGSEGRIGEAGATPGVIPLHVRGRFVDGDQFNDLAQFGGHRMTDDEAYAALRRAGYDGVTRNGDTVIFPEAEGRGVVRNAITQNIMFANGNPLAGAIVPTWMVAEE